MESLSKEYMINQVKTHKDNIRDATDRLSEILFKARKRLSKDLQLNEKDSLAVRKILHEIVSELSMIGGYCDSRTQRYIDETANIIGIQTSVTRIRYPNTLMLDWWAMRVNSIIVDYTKIPFRLSQLKPILSVLEKIFEKVI